MIVYIKLLSGEEIVARQILTPSMDTLIVTTPFKFYYFMDVPGSMSWRLIRWFPVRSMMASPQAIDRSMVILIAPAEAPLTTLFEQHEAVLMESLKPVAEEAEKAPSANTASPATANTGSAPTDPESKEHYKNILSEWKPPSEAN